MARATTISILAAGVLIAAGGSMTRLGATEKTETKSTCVQADAAGDYGFQFFGFIRPSPNEDFVPFAESGKMLIDAQGNLSGSSTFSVGGQILSHTFEGSITVKSDCTATSVIPEDSLGFKNLTSFWVIVKPGRDALLTSTSSAGAVNGRVTGFSRD